MGLWVGTTAGLVRIGKGGEQLLTSKDGLADSRILCLAESREGGLWIGTRNGFSRLRNGEIESYRPQEGLSQSTVYSMFEDVEGSLWVGTKNGLNQFFSAPGAAVHGERRAAEQRHRPDSSGPERRYLDRDAGSGPRAVRREAIPGDDQQAGAGFEHDLCAGRGSRMARCGWGRHRESTVCGTAKSTRTLFDGAGVAFG